MRRESNTRRSRPALLAVGLAGLLSTTLTACGGSDPDPDPRAALRAVCGKDSAITTAEPDPDPDDVVKGDTLECDTGHGNAVAEQYRRDTSDIADVEAEEYESGNGDQLAYAVTETGGGAGTVVYLYPGDGEVGERTADRSLLDPLRDDGWEIGPD